MRGVRKANVNKVESNSAFAAQGLVQGGKGACACSTGTTTATININNNINPRRFATYCVIEQQSAGCAITAVITVVQAENLELE